MGLGKQGSIWGETLEVSRENRRGGKDEDNHRIGFHHVGKGKCA